MRGRSIVGLALSIGIAATLTYGMDEKDADAKASRRMEGTWEVTYPNAPNLRHLKVMSPDHFMWSTFDKTTGQPLQVCGGRWKIHGDGLTETVLFANFSKAGMDSALGKEQTMDFRFENDDRVFVSGMDKTTGKRWSEVTTRAKESAAGPLK